MTAGKRSPAAAAAGSAATPGDVEDVDDDSFSPFAAAATPASPHAPGSPSPARRLDADASAAAAAELRDDVAPLPDTTAAAAAGAGPPSSSAAVGGGSPPHKAGSAAAAGIGAAAKPRSRRKLIPLKQVIRCSYEYHGLNDLAMFCVTALAVTMVLYWHWTETTATFKATVQRSFQEYGNPDWQSQSLNNVETMYDAVEYSVGWLEFWLQRADAVGWANETVRVGEFGDVSYVRMLVNVDRNCDPSLASHLECYRDDSTTAYLARTRGGGGQQHANLLEWAGWQDVAKLTGRGSSKAGKPDNNKWWSYALLAPKFNGQPSTRDNFVGRMYNITRNTNLNAVGNCDWANHTCAEVGPFTNSTPAGPPCVQRGVQVPFSSWWESPVMCSSAGVRDRMSPGTNSVQRGQRFFVRHPQALDADKPPGTPNVLDLKPFLSKYAYSIAIDVLASNAFARGGSDMALFSMVLQRSAQVKDEPDRILWQITSTIPVRTSFYSQPTDFVRIGFEALLYVCLLVVLSLQVWQVYVCYMQHSSFRSWVAHFWNCFELLSNITLLAWVVFYWVLFVWLQRQSWQLREWDVLGSLAHDKLNSISSWASSYSAWLYMGIIVDFLICMRLARYMRIHVGLKAFYQVFLIAAREFLDFAVFLFYILVLLGSSVFAFFQLTGGNFEFLRFPDGLSTMTRLTFGFLSYEDFQAQALGLGAAVSAVTLLFWVAVLLLVVFAQNIILAIVAEAYEEAKAKLGTAETSFLMLVLMRLLFFALFVIYRLRMLCRDIFLVCLGRKPRALPAASFKRSASSLDGGTATTLLNNPGADGSDGAPGSGGGSGAAAIGRAGSKGAHAWQPGQGLHDGDVELLRGDSGYMLAPTSSRAVLPLDVEAGLMAGSGKSKLSSSRISFDAAAAGGTGSGVFAAPGGNGHVAGAVALSAAGSRGEVAGEQPRGVRQRLSVLWHDVILGERHSLRMYNDISLAPGEKEDSWVRSWKERYWRPWCVARTEPLRCLMNLYQDFASYKLKEACTWTANSDAKAVIASTWKHRTAAADDGGDDDDSDAASSSRALMTFPMLQDEVYVDEDTLARLFLVTSNMSSVLKIWQPPFHQLTTKEVSYLVKGISDVYGVDEQALLPQGTVYVSGVMQALGPSSGSSGGVASTVSTDMRDARLGDRAPRKGSGGFISNLNAMRRQGGSAEHTRQISWLLHANKRLEEAALRNASQLSSANTRLVHQMALQDDFQRKQQRTNSQLLKGMQELSTLLHAQQQLPAGDNSGPLMLVGAAAAADAGSNSGRPAAVRKINSIAASATSRVFGGGSSSSQGGARGARPRSSTGALSPSASAGFSNPGSPTSVSDAAGVEWYEASAAAAEQAGVGEVVAGLQAQLQVQQELLQQVLARLPPPAQ